MAAASAPTSTVSARWEGSPPARAGGGTSTRAPAASSLKGSRAPQSREAPRAQPPPRGPIKRVAGVFAPPRDPRGRAAPRPLLAQAHRRAELGARRRPRLKAPPHARQLEPHRRVVLERQHHLE